MSNLNIEDFDLVEVTKVDTVIAPETRFYDLTVSGDHTFFIRVGNMDVLVHNCDGIHICQLYMGWWLKLAPELFEQKRICRLVTPLAVLYSDASKKKIVKYFYTLSEYKEYEAKNPEVVRKGKVSYYKGLGSWSKEEFQKLFASSKNGIEDFLEPIVFKSRPGDDEILDDWLSDTKSDKRKEYLRNYNLDINQV